MDSSTRNFRKQMTIFIDPYIQMSQNLAHTCWELRWKAQIFLSILLILRSILCRYIATSINTDTSPRRPYMGITLLHKHCRRRSEVTADVDDPVADVADVTAM